MSCRKSRCGTAHEWQGTSAAASSLAASCSCAASAASVASLSAHGSDSLATLKGGERHGLLPSEVTNMGYLFMAQAEFNSDLSSWDVSDVTDQWIVGNSQHLGPRGVVALWQCDRLAVALRKLRLLCYRLP